MSKKINNTRSELFDWQIQQLRTASIIIETQKKIISSLEKEIETLEKENSILKNNKGFHSRELMFEAFYQQQIRVAEKRTNKRLKLMSDFEAIIAANKKLKLYKENYLLLDKKRESKEFGKIILSFSRHYKPQFKKDFGNLIQLAIKNDLLIDKLI